jgi:hypothetical protein
MIPVSGCVLTFDSLKSLKSWRLPFPNDTQTSLRVRLSTTAWLLFVWHFFFPECQAFCFF